MKDPWLDRTIDGRYVVFRMIGKGGMGAVYEADQPSVGQRVAIKFLADRDLEDSARERFRREARLASKVVHEHVAQVFDTGTTEDGHEYIVMEYVEGTDLWTLLKDHGRLSIERALAIARQMLDGLAAIHSQGIIHRDVKPSNVLLTRRGESSDFVKIADFGLARGHDDVTLTKTGNIVGTTPFMAPEIFRGEPLDARTDLYAVGITLYQMLSGKLPFEGATAEIGAAHVFEPPPPLGSLRTGIPDHVLGAIDRALAKSPADRFPDARAFRDALDRRASRPSLPAVRRRRRWPWVIAAGVIVAGGAIGAVLAQRSSRVATPAQPQATLDASIGAALDAAALASSVTIDAALAIDAGAAAPLLDAGRAGKPGRPVAGSRASGMCFCMPANGENTPLCAKQGKPLCRCDDAQGRSLCMRSLAECRSHACSHGDCPDADWERFQMPGTQGAACRGFLIYTGHYVGTLDDVNQEYAGHLNCDSCPGATNRVFPGTQGDPCTGYYWRTAEATPGTLQHCEP